MLAVSSSPKKKKVVQVRLLSGEEIRVPVDVSMPDVLNVSIFVKIMSVQL